jgi:NADH-quinone oxidoreductase subunit F
MEKVLTNMVGVPRSWTLDSYRSRGGYQALPKALDMTRDAIVDEMKKSNLRGRGGAGFPTGTKWSFVPNQSDVPKYLVVNADEGEPGTFKDRLLMGLNPHMLVEGCIIAGWALGLRATYIFIRGEMVHEARRLEEAIREAYEAGYLGQKIFGREFTHDIYVHRGAGAYICGEETALIEALEGKAGQPRLKPPFPAVVGVFSCPTLVNNVETIACVPLILEKGGDWWSAQGCSRNGGPKLVGISGHVRRPGIYEVPHGLPIYDLIYGEEYGGGMRLGKDGKPVELKAVIPGGASCPVLRPEDLRSMVKLKDRAGAVIEERMLGMDFDTMSTSPKDGGPGSMLGTACVTVMDTSTCMVRVAANLAHFYHHESCGQCTPCREGSGWVARVLDEIEAGRAKPQDVELLMDICNNLDGNTICPFGDALAMAVRSYLQKFPEEFTLHVEQKRCPYPRW